jgi:hypothetical protein
MTVNDLITALSALPEEHRALELRLWLPGSQICIEDKGWFHTYFTAPTGEKLPEPIIIVEANIFPGSVLQER